MVGEPSVEGWPLVWALPYLEQRGWRVDCRRFDDRDSESDGVDFVVACRVTKPSTVSLIVARFVGEAFPGAPPAGDGGG